MDTIEAARMAVSPRFFPLLRIPIVEGRAFQSSDVAGKQGVAIVTIGLARRLWSAESAALGRSLVLGRDPGLPVTVVGVVPDVRSDDNEASVRSAVYVPIAQQPPAAVVVGLRTTDPTTALATVEDAVRGVNADIPVYSPTMLTQSRLDVLGARLLAVTVLGIFGLTVLALSSVGIYAVVSQSVQERAHELRIRLTFGANPMSLLAGELARAARLIVVSVVVGIGVAVLVLRVIGATFQGFSGSIVTALAGSTTALVALAFVATAIPAWRAVRGDLMTR
jgi:ABC-type antimicrobial peptide transport system permease subunit